MSAEPSVDDFGQVVRFSLADMPVWGEWLIERLSERHPGFNRATWLGKLNGMLSANDFLFVRNERSVLCLSAQPRVLDGHLVVLEVFAYSRDAVKRDIGWRLPPLAAAERSLVALYRHAQQWARSKGAARLFVGQDTDVTPARLMTILNAPAVGWVGLPL